MTNDIGWWFPPTHGGTSAGFNDSGIAHFSGAPLSSLARETIQNSLDARKGSEEPVHVSFELIHLEPDDIGRNELIDAISACKKVEINDETVTAALQTAEKSICKDKIPCLRISDRNTTGLSGEQWHTLVKMQGKSHKPDLEGAGGSHGIGKYAPFSVSAPRTVFYWTCYQQNKKDVEKFQGKSILMSHYNKEGETQGTGYYGIKEGCSELKEGKIPECFRIPNQSHGPVHGTSLVILGFRETEDWRQRVARSVIENFFHAISTENLTVTIEPDDSDSESQLFEINKESLEEWFDKLSQAFQTSDDGGDEDGSELERARIFWEMSNAKDPTAERQDPEFGHCRLWIRVAEGLPSRVAFVRLTGMVITTQQQNLRRFSGFRDFAALCVFEDPSGNEFLRRMENPRHDQFEPDRLPEKDRARGWRALRAITRWIREEIRKYAGPPEGGKKTVLSELAAYLPDFRTDEPFEDVSPDGEKIREPGFGERIKVTLKPIRRPTPQGLPAENEEISEDSDGADTGEFGGSGTGSNGGGGGSGGSGEGEGEGGTGVRGGSSKRRSIPISGVRILSIEGRENCYRLSFRPNASGLVRLELDEAGDSSAIRRTDVRAVADGGSLDHVQLTKGKRTIIEITADSPIGGRAWRLSAIAGDGGSP